MNHMKRQSMEENRAGRTAGRTVGKKAGKTAGRTVGKKAGKTGERTVESMEENKVGLPN
jgi:hypothetical protein